MMLHVNPMVTCLSCHVCLAHAAGEALTQAENKFAQIAVKVVKFLVFDAFRVNIFLVAVASVVNTEKLYIYTQICVHMLDDRHLDGHASIITIWDVFMFRLREKKIVLQQHNAEEQQQNPGVFLFSFFFCFVFKGKSNKNAYLLTDAQENSRFEYTHTHEVPALWGRLSS